MVARARRYIAYKETYLLIIDANIRHALFLCEVTGIYALHDETGRSLPVRVGPLELTQQPVAAFDG